jgi:hypothetical protein
MYDARLDYENYKEVVETSSSYFNQYKDKLQKKHSEGHEIDDNFDIMNMQTDHFSHDLFFQKLLDKINELKFNINQIITNFCEPIGAPIKHGKKVLTLEDYKIYKSRISIRNSSITHSEKGSFKVLLKVIPVIKFSRGKDADNILITLSRVATIMRMSQCLLNPMAYNILDSKFDRIVKSIQERAAALTALILNKESNLPLDSISPIDCKYYTPSSKKNSINLSFNAKTVFYLTYPYITSSLENLFFFDSNLIKKHSETYSWFTNDLTFRVKLSLIMVDNLISLHKTGVIISNIRLSNLFYFVSNPSSEDAVTSMSISFGNFTQSGIDNYDSRILKNFYVPEDGRFEIGPKIDVYQLGLAIFQMTFMLPSDSTLEMNLSIIDYMRDPGYMIILDSNPMHLFKEMMSDALKDKSDYKKYSEIMTKNAVKCTFKIFKMIILYFQQKIWEKTESAYDTLKEVFYNFQPKEGDEYSLEELIKYPKFQYMFVSVFLNLFPYINTCSKKIKVPESFLNVIRQMIHPNVNYRISLQMARKLILEEIELTKGDDYENNEYQPYDSKEFKPISRSSLLVRKSSFTQLF